MLSDRKASELISHSFRRELTEEESRAINEHLAKDANSQAFAKISRVIHNSLSDIAVMAESGDESVAPEMSAAAKDRLRQSVRLATERQRAESRGPAKPDAPRTNRDLALASTLLQDGHVTDEQMCEAVDGWDPNDGGSLGEHLVRQGVISDELRQQLEAKTAEGLPADSTDDDAGDRATAAGQEEADSRRKLSGSRALSRLSTRISMAAPDPPPASDTRQLVSRFTLIRKLGEGGLGSVWLARDEKLKRTVAIKEISAAAAQSPRTWQRFHREAEITGHLEHPNIVPLYQFGTDPKSGQPFYAMRFVGKHTLADAIIEYHERRADGDDDALQLHRLLTAFIAICQAVAYAHSRGVIHRDLKPENVAIDNFGQVIVLDWGLAKLADDGELATQLTMAHEDDEGGNDSVLARTMAGEVIGTPLYMAPEQASGDLDNIDEKTDVYGLGAILFAILTGNAPHENSNTSQDGNLRVKELLIAIAEGKTPVPRDFNPNVPGDLEAICMKSMSHKRYARHAGASELADDVQRWMAEKHEKQQQYDNMRMEGRELRANLQSSVRDLGTNARFVANLPPIQQIVDARCGIGDDGEDVWRERLSTIFKGLLRANANYSAIAFCRVEDAEFTEIVRVERHSTDRANVRSVPLSRLATASPGEFVQMVMRQLPGEVFVDLTDDLESQRAGPNAERCRALWAATPIFNERTEQPFGFVVIECDLQRLLEIESRDRVRTAQQVVVLDPDWAVCFHDTRGQGRIEQSAGKPAIDVIAGIDKIKEALSKQAEFLDDTDRELYATRLQLAAGQSGLVFVLIRKPFAGSRDK